MGSDDSGDEEDAVDFQAQVSTMLNPLITKQKKASKKIADLELKLAKLEKLNEDQVPAIRKEMTSNTSDVSARLERLHADLVQCALKSTVELFNQEHVTAESALRAVVDETRGKAAAHDMMMQAMENRVEQMERQLRATESKLGGELSAASAQIATLQATCDRQRGELDAKVAEVGGRAQAQLDILANRVAQEVERLDKRLEGGATKAEVAEVREMMKATQHENEMAAGQSREQWKRSEGALEEIRVTLGTAVQPSALQRVEARSEEIMGELKRLMARQEEKEEAARGGWEDKLTTRQMHLETAAREGQRQWHQLSAQVEAIQRQLTEHSLKNEHDSLNAKVESLLANSASKDELAAIGERVAAAATNAALEQLSAELRALQENVKSSTESAFEGLARAAGGDYVAELDSRVSALQQAVEGKMGEREGAFALQQKMEKAQGDQLVAQVQAAHDRLTALQERANNFELQVGHASSSHSTTGVAVQSLQAEIADLRSMSRMHHEESKSHVSEFHDLLKAVRALAADAELRCALDEREMEFLWAAPSQIYGQHGWRANNGSVSERTPYPVNNFKVAVRHGAEGNARETLAQRKKLLNSISMGKRDVDRAEIEAIVAGTPSEFVGSPVRLPAVDEIRRKPQGGRSRPGSGGSRGGGNDGILGPARDLLDAHLYHEGQPPRGAPSGGVETPRNARVKRQLQAREGGAGHNDHWVEAGSQGSGGSQGSQGRISVH